QPAEPASPGLLAAQENVVGDAELRNQVQLLIDDSDPAVLGVARPREPERPAAQTDLTLVFRDRAGEDLHQGTLAGAVLTAKGMYLTPPGRERHVLERTRAP